MGNPIAACIAPQADVRSTSQTRPPSTVRPSRTVDGGRIWDVAAAARHLRGRFKGEVPLVVGGVGAAGVIGAYAALLEPDISGVIVIDPPSTHMDAGAP